MSSRDSESCRVVVFSEVGKPMELREVPIPKLQDQEVLVRVTCCTVCGSDLHTFHGRRSGPTPSVLGHEIIGVIDQISGAVEDAEGKPLRVGDRVTWSVAASCGCCSRCEVGIPQKCETLFKYGHADFTESEPLGGGLAEYCLLRSGTAIVPLPPDLADEILCPANCATATSMAAIRAGGPVRGQRVLIYGAGMLGLTTSAIAASMDAASITVLDLDESRLATAKQFGATSVGQTRSTDGLESSEFDLIFEMSGSSSAVEEAILAASIGGSVVLVGSVFPSPPVSVDPERVVRYLLSIHGVHNYAPQDLVAAVAFLTNHGERFPFAQLVTEVLALEQANDAFIRPSNFAQPIRVAIKP